MTAERISRFAEAVLLAEPQTTREAYWIGRVTLLTGQGQIPVFDRIFDSCFRGYIDLVDDAGAPSAAAERSPLAEGERAPRETRSEHPATTPPPITGATPGVDARGDNEAEESSLLAASSTSERLAGLLGVLAG